MAQGSEAPPLCGALILSASNTPRLGWQRPQSLYLGDPRGSPLSCRGATDSLKRCATAIATTKPCRASAASSLPRKSAKRSAKMPRTFSIRIALGRSFSLMRSIAGNISRSSPAPNCFPAIENGGQGSPPESKATSRQYDGSKRSMSAWITFQYGRLRRRVAQAWGSARC